MNAEDFAYELPAAQIAQHPPVQRDGGRLMRLDRSTQEVHDHRIPELPRLLPAEALVVVNDSRVVPARLLGRRQTGGQVELLLLEPDADDAVGVTWLSMVRSSKRLHDGERIELERPAAAPAGPSASTVQTAVEIVNEPVNGRCRVRLPYPAAVHDLGAIPLPPYIQRPADANDRTRYQTVYAAHDGSIAAPTAGLHLTEELLAALDARGIEVARVTLHVGPGTFQPVRTEDVREHEMESERYAVPPDTAQRIAAAKAAGRPVIAVGTTVVRTLESTRGLAGAGRTRLFITPGHEFSVVDGLLTNFHLPRSTLLMLVSAFADREFVLAAYRRAVAAGYRFYSYGDAMLIL